MRWITFTSNGRNQWKIYQSDDTSHGAHTIVYLPSDLTRTNKQIVSVSVHVQSILTTTDTESQPIMNNIQMELHSTVWWPYSLVPIQWKRFTNRTLARFDEMWHDDRSILMPDTDKVHQLITFRLVYASFYSYRIEYDKNKTTTITNVHMHKVTYARRCRSNHSHHHKCDVNSILFDMSTKWVIHTTENIGIKTMHTEWLELDRITYVRGWEGRKKR